MSRRRASPGGLPELIGPTDAAPAEPTPRPAGPRSPASGSRVHGVLHQFKNGELHTGSGQRVTSRRQALAIALSLASPPEDRRGSEADPWSAAAAPRVDVATVLGALRELDPELARKVLPARGQLSLFAASTAPIDHLWVYQGQELKAPHATLEACKLCPVQRRTVRRFTRPMVYYCRRHGEPWERVRPACAAAAKGGADGA